MIRFVLVDRHGIAPHAGALGALEEGIRYPVADGADHFTIDHGPLYHPFFSALGEAFFLIAKDGERAVGVAVGVRRRVDWCGRAITSFYVCDLKVAPDQRGTGLARRMMLHGLAGIPRDRRFLDWKLLYGAAMRGERGDVMRSARGLSPMRLFSPLARLRIYFAPPADLARLDVRRAPPPPATAGASLSPDAVTTGPSRPCLGEQRPGDPSPGELGILSTAGRKDLCLASTGAPWPLVHLSLGPRAWGPSWGAYLEAAGRALVEQGASGPACFAIDERLADHIAWLGAEGIAPGAVCTVHAFALPPRLPPPPWVHLATSEI